MVLWKLQDEADIHVVQQGSILLEVRKGGEVGMTYEEKWRKVIAGIEWALENMVDPLHDFMFAGYDGPMVMVNEPIMRDILAMLKAHIYDVPTVDEMVGTFGKELDKRIAECKLPRRMSLEEVLASTGKPVYVICKEHPEGYALVSGEIGGRVALTYPGTPEGKDNMLWPIKAGYGSFWECWTSPQIDAQREERSWEE